MDKKPLVSIAIPCYNCASHIDDAIQSVLNQTYTNWELLLIDDGSKDGTLSILKKYSDPRITVTSDGQNKGLPVRLNESVKWASGLYYARMDADDIMRFDRLEKQVDFLLKNPNIDVLGSSAFIIDENNNITNVYEMGFKDKTESFIHPSVIGKIEWFQNNQYNERLRRCQDLELWKRTISYSKFYSSEEKLLYYRDNLNFSYKKYMRSTFYELRFIYARPKTYHLSLAYSISKILKSLIALTCATLFYPFGIYAYVKRKYSYDTLKNNDIEIASQLLSKSIL